MALFVDETTPQGSLGEDGVPRPGSLTVLDEEAQPEVVFWNKNENVRDNDSEYFNISVPFAEQKKRLVFIAFGLAVAIAGGVMQSIWLILPGVFVAFSNTVNLFQREILRVLYDHDSKILKKRRSLGFEPWVFQDVGIEAKDIVFIGVHERPCAIAEGEERPMEYAIYVEAREGMHQKHQYVPHVHKTISSGDAPSSDTKYRVVYLSSFIAGYAPLKRHFIRVANELAVCTGLEEELLDTHAVGEPPVTSPKSAARAGIQLTSAHPVVRRLKPTPSFYTKHRAAMKQIIKEREPEITLRSTKEDYASANTLGLNTSKAPASPRADDIAEMSSDEIVSMVVIPEDPGDED